MNICVNTYRYPGKYSSSDFVFVQQLVEKIAEMGHHCYVVCPYNVTHYRRIVSTLDDKKVGAGCVTVLRPYYLSFATLTIRGKSVSYKNRKKALLRGLAQIKDPIDVLYGQFWYAALELYPFAREHQLPLVVATGESVIASTISPRRKYDYIREYVTGVICVSTKNKNESIQLGLTTEEKCLVAPNAIDNSLFKRLDKVQCRKKLGFPEDKFIVAFVGWFDSRKGASRVSSAIDRLHDDSIYSIFVGKKLGADYEEPNCKNILFKGVVAHEEVPLYLNAADVFVLPTRHEGCCNAIVEAMACGLPIISSDRPFNYDVLNGDNAIMVEPDDIDAISQALLQIKGNEALRQRMSEKSLEMAQSLTLQQRAEHIVTFIQQQISK